MEPIEVSTNQGISVRWPFRILAGFVLLMCVATLIGTGLVAWYRGLASLKWQFLVQLPAIAWLARLSWSATIRGNPPDQAYWPFSSLRMFKWYMVIFVVALFA
jgi:hypothetical protein